MPTSKHAVAPSCHSRRLEWQCKFFVSDNNDEEEEEEEEDQLKFNKTTNITHSGHTSLLSHMLNTNNHRQPSSPSFSPLKRCQAKYHHLHDWFCTHDLRS